MKIHDRKVFLFANDNRTKHTLFDVGGGPGEAGSHWAQDAQQTTHACNSN